MKEHKKSHVRLNDIGADVSYVPQQVEELRLHSDLPLYSMILQQDGLDLTNEVKGHESPEELVDEDGDLNIEDADFEGTLTARKSEENEQNSSTLSSQEDQELSTFGNEILSKEHRHRMLEQNTNRWSNNKHLKVSFMNLGLTCLGPTSNPGLFVSERCPNEVVIDLDTARLVLRRRPKSQLILDNRRVSCRFYNQVTTFLTRYEIELEDENTVCTFHGSDQFSFHGSGRYAQHLSNIISKSYREKTTIDIRLLQETFKSAARKRWEFPPYSNIVRRRISEILQGERAGSDLVILDGEFSPALSQVWEFAIVERVSGKVLINTTIDHKDGLDHSTWDDHPFLKMMSRSKATQVFSPSRIRDTGRINVDEIASKLQEAGITQGTIILVYHKSPFDLRILRGFLESAAYHGILPPDENCIPLLQLLRANLSVAPSGHKGFPLALECLLPIMYPHHQLVGLNHQALEDCQQTRLVCMAFDHLCKPIAERGKEWQPDGVAKSAQTSILDWLQRSGLARIFSATTNLGRLTDRGGVVNSLFSKDAGPLELLQDTAYTNDGKAIIADYSGKAFDRNPREDQLTWSPFTFKQYSDLMGTLGLSVNELEFVGRNTITNLATKRTIKTAFERMGFTSHTSNDVVTIRFDASKGSGEEQSYDALSRCDDVNGVWWMLGDNYQDFGGKFIAASRVRLD